MTKMLHYRFISTLLVLVILSGNLFPVEADDNASGFKLTSEEQNYLHTLQSKPVVIAYSYDLVHNEAGGMLDPVLDVLRNVFGLTVNTVKLNWHDAFEALENKTADFYGPIAISENRRQKYIVAEPFYRSYSKVITRADNPLHSIVGLHNRSIGLLEGSALSRTMQTYLGPNGQIKYFPSMDALINALKTESIDAFATVDNAEFEILSHDDIQFEFTMDNSFADQGLISGNEDMRMLASLLTRYLKENPDVSDEIPEVRSQALFRNSREFLTGEIAYLQKNYTEITMYSDKYLYPLCYVEKGATKGMQLEINEIFEELTGVKVRFDEEKNYPEGVASVFQRLKSGECMAFVGEHLSIDLWNDAELQYSPLVWMETIRTYSNKNLKGNLQDKTIGALHCVSDYLGWNNTTGNAPVYYYSRSSLLNGLKNGEIDIIFMGEMVFNYHHSILGDYAFREVGDVSAQAPLHMLYGAQNKEFNALFNEAIKLFNIVDPQSMGKWKAQSDKYKSDSIRMRYTQQIVSTIAIIAFVFMLAALFYLFLRNKQAHNRTRDILADVEEKRQIILDSITYASKIQKNLLPDESDFSKAFSDHSVIWKPRDVVGGDIYWIKNFEMGSVLCVCDCTGHGTPGALLTMIVVSALESVVRSYNCHDTAEIVWQLERRIVNVFNLKPEGVDEGEADIRDGCDLAVLFVAKDGSVTFSAANTNVFVCDGKEAKRIRGQKIYIGEGKINGKNDIKTFNIPAGTDNKFYIASDGLFDQPGDKQPVPFGYKRFKKIILENHEEQQPVVSERIWEAFETYRGEEIRVDDFELITFKP